MERKNKLKKVLPVILLLLLITIIIGVTYAAYLITLQSGENSITTGLVSMSYTESTNVITIENALPISDSLGKTSNNYFDFSITSNLTLNENNPNTDVNYSIEIEPLSTNTLQDNQIKLYLEDTTNNRVIIDSRLISNITNNTLYNTKHTHIYNLNTITTNYRLRAWIDYNVDSSNWSNNGYEYKFKINVNGDINSIKIGTTPEYCFETSGSTIDDYLCYSGNSYGYETITDVVIPETINGVVMTSIRSLYRDPNSPGLPISNTYGKQTIHNNAIISLSVEKMYETFNGTFQNKGLTSVTIPNSVTSIGYGAFFDNKLTSVTIPNGVTTIGRQAFQSNNLSEVIIPSSVTTIDDYAFQVNKLTSVKIIGKSSSSDFTTYGSNIWGWATGYSDSNIIWNYTE